MAENVRISARSNHGCWTCRLRKKKCDENRPVCSACISLELECHGYGPRPEWMDNGVLQRDQASKFKRLVSQAKSKRAKRQQILPNQSPLPSHIDMRPLSSDNVSSPADPPPNLVDQHLGTFSQDEFHYQDSGIGSSCFIDPLWSLWPSNDICMMDSSLDLESYSFTHTTLQNQYSMQQLLSPESFEGTLVPPASLPILHETTETSGGLTARKDTHFTNDESARSTPNELQDSAFHDDRRPPKDYDYVRSSSLISSPSGGTEDGLFMYYLDEVFYLQYPFYHSQKRQGRGWLLAILRKVKSAYHATLALSESHLLSMQSRNSDVTTRLIQLRSQNSHYDLAIQELQLMINDSYTAKEPVRLIPTVEIIMSLLQLLFFELCNGGREKWQTHLRTACSFVPTLLQARATILDSKSLDHTIKQGQNITLCPEVASAVNFVIGSFIAFDIISSASTRSTPLLNIDHFQVVDKLGISLECLTGCRDSVMALILEISLLDRWKKEAQSANKLSFVDLAKRGDRLQERLRQELAAIEKQLSTLTTSSSSSSDITPKPTLPKISKIFVLSAITYLHVIISGAYPEVPEIAESISETILAFKGLKDPSLLRNVVWPFCISGCLALDKHYDFFRGLVSRAGITQQTTGTCFEALQIMEECWKARVISSESCDWATAMKRRGCYVFLW